MSSARGAARRSLRQILDTGETLKVDAARRRDYAPPSTSVAPVKPESEAVVIRFQAVQKGHSVRLRISETDADEKSYRSEGDELVFDRSFGRPKNAVVLPAGWYLTACAIPATISTLPDGRIRLDFVNPRPDEIAVPIKAKRQPSPPPGKGRGEGATSLQRSPIRRTSCRAAYLTQEVEVL